MNKKYWSYEEVEKLFNMYKEGNTLSAISKALDRSTVAIEYYLNVYNFMINGRTSFQNTYSQRMIRYIRKYIKDNGIEIKQNTPSKETPLTKPVDTNHVHQPGSVTELLIKLQTQFEEIQKTIVMVIDKGVEVQSNVKLEELRDENKTLKKRVLELENFKETAKKSSIWAQLTQKFS